MLGISSKRLTIFENRLHHSPARIYLLKVNVRTLEQGVRHVQISHLILAFLLLTLNMLLLAGRCWTLSKILLCNSVSNRILSIEPCQLLSREVHHTVPRAQLLSVRAAGPTRKASYLKGKCGGHG